MCSKRAGYVDDYDTVPPLQSPMKKAKAKSVSKKLVMEEDSMDLYLLKYRMRLQMEPEPGLVMDLRWGYYKPDLRFSLDQLEVWLDAAAYDHTWATASECQKDYICLAGAYAGAHCLDFLLHCSSLAPPIPLLGVLVACLNTQHTTTHCLDFLLLAQILHPPAHV